MAADAQAHAAKLVPGFTPVKRIGSMSCQRVQDHYARSGTGRGIAARIIQALRATTGADVAITPETLAPFDHVHGCGVLATQDLVAPLEPRAGETILDIGSGSGGPTRWIAEKHDCTVTRMDLTAKYCDAARELRIASGMADRVRFIEGSALALPLPDAGFDRAYSHNVVMNLAFRDTTQRNLSANAALRRKVETEGQPLAGVHVLMGELNREPPPCAPGRTAG